jgi:hypothetical protein
VSARVCIDVYVYACMHACMRVSMYVCMYWSARCVGARAYRCICICVYACMHACMYAVCVYVCMRLGTNVHLCPCVHATMHPAFTNFITRRLALPLPPPHLSRTHTRVHGDAGAAPNNAGYGAVLYLYFGTLLCFPVLKCRVL